MKQLPIIHVPTLQKISFTSVPTFTDVAEFAASSPAFPSAVDTHRGMRHFIPYSILCDYCRHSRRMDAILRLEYLYWELAFVAGLLNITVGKYYTLFHIFD